MGCIHTPNPHSDPCGNCRAADLESKLTVARGLLEEHQRESDRLRAELRVAKSLGLFAELFGERSVVEMMRKTFREQPAEIDQLRTERDEARGEAAAHNAAATQYEADIAALKDSLDAECERAEKAVIQLDALEILIRDAFPYAYDDGTEDGEPHVAELLEYAADEIKELRKRAEKAERERDEARAERDALHVALELAEVEVALDRSWCRICRTECRGAHRGRREHMHATECVLDIRAHAAKAVKP